ncbi:MAG: 50S ribosome-binding GTPase [Caldisphaeraceae archaeon]|nr:50S ribosome-binding GTPase [Caldisphaeraceae archaeon]MEB3692675.1 50S ribosome-binding GTPase [Caldisphaeraceae archaeon]MEB3797320.1 50S ribosome-binding GTPase [Caldisphaeraceae archaeon]
MNKAYETPQLDYIKSIHIPLYDEILQKIKSRYPKRTRKIYERELRSIELVYNILNSKTLPIIRLERFLKNLHVFYWSLIEIGFDRKTIDNSIRCIKKLRLMAKRFWVYYRNIIVTEEDPRVIRKIGNEARGRMLSQAKKCSKSFEYLKNLVIFLENLPSIDPYKKTIIVAGPPNAGKSTFVNNVSSAKPEIAAYPFTTKKIILGHYREGHESIQIIDTPGILDRPFVEMNNIERMAIFALKFLTGLVIFIVDPSPFSYMNLENQFKIIKQIEGIMPKKPLVVVINKVDTLEKSKIDQIEKELRKRIQHNNIYRASLVNKEESIKILIEVIKSLYPSP